MVKFIIKDMDIRKVDESGQCFNMFCEDGRYFIISGSRACWVSQKGTDSLVECLEVDVSYWRKYFCFYDGLYERLYALARGDNNSFIRDAVEHGRGLRMLLQDPFECLISFIVSQRKSIPAIKTSLTRLAERYGDVLEFDDVLYYTFPSPVRLVEGYELNRYSDCGLGYRDTYVYKASKQVLEANISLESLRDRSYAEASSYLKGFSGVGSKVADCVCLYSLGKHNAFPVDVWMSRILDNYFTEEEYRQMLSRYDGVLGLLQMYMFYYGRGRV